MCKPKTLAFLLCLTFSQIYLTAQDKLNIKFGKIAPADFNTNAGKLDSGADAIVIADIGSTEFEGNRKGKGRFSMVYKRYKRIKILSRKGYDIADEEIETYSDGDAEETLTEVKAVTYNLEGGKVVETRLESKSIFTEKTGKYNAKVRFTMPAIREGSIIEIAYTIKSDFYQFLRAWNFESEYPCHWSEYSIRIPEYFNYVVRTQGDQQFLVKTSGREKGSYTIRFSGGASSNDEVSLLEPNDLVAHWVKKDVAAFKTEPFTTTTANYVSRVEFQLSYFQFSVSSQPQNYLGTWQTVSEKLLRSENFGTALANDNHWMREEINAITAACQNKQEKIGKIYTYIRDHFTCTNHDALLANKPLKTVFKDHSGNVAEINLLLVAMLRNEEIDADPVILSTRDNGIPSQTYPMLEHFNYVICTAHYESNTYLLDASWPSLGFNHLPEEAYNGPARTINKESPSQLDLNPEALTETKNVSVLIINDERGFPSGSFQSTPGYFESCEIREKLRKKTQTEYFKEIQTSYGSDMELENTGIDSLTKPEFPVQVHYDFNMKSFGHENIIYFKPMLSETTKENPFKSAERKYPVEMPYKMEEVYTFTMDIPEGYSVEELPKSAKVAYNENEGLFEYLIQKNESTIQLRTRIKLNKANFSPEEYNTLRDFFGVIVKKQNEQIVFKKK